MIGSQTMARKVIGQIKLQINAGQANPAPPVGPALGQQGVNIMEFCKKFNAQTQGMDGKIPVIITVFSDRSFSFITKSPTASYLLMKAAKIKKGSGVPNQQKVARLNRSQLEEIASIKHGDLTASDLDAAVRTLAGTARSMGIDTDL